LNNLLLDTKKRIGLAHNNNQVDEIYNEVSEQMKTIVPSVDSKASARSVLRALANQLIQTFSKTPDVTNEERDEIINRVKEQLEAVIKAIDKDTRDIQVA